MYKQFRLRVIFSLILAIIAGFLVYTYLEKLQQKEAVVAAKQVIEPATKITPELLTIIYINKKDKELLFPKAVDKPEELVGAITRVKIEPNKPIEKTPENLVFGEDTALALNYERQVDEAFFIPYDKRIVSIDVDASGALNFKLRRGNFVDVIYTSVDENTGGLFSTMILQHVQIYDIEDVRTEKNGSGLAAKRQNVMLMVTPEQSLQLTVAKRNGVLDLVLNPLTGETKNIKPVHLLEFAARPPMRKSEILKNLEENIKLEDISESVKKQLLDNIEKERQVDTLRHMVEASRLTDDQKEKILQLLK